MPSPINLNNVNISLSEFQRISEGKYNAGEVRLENTTKLAKMNHHVHFTSFNKTEISHSEVLAIKNAFVKALSENSVDQKEIDRIRRDLGLDSTGAGDRTLHARSLKPLSRQMIREILDRNASAISPESGVRTSEQIYGNGGMKESRMNTRNEINASLDSKSHTVDDNKLFSHFHNLVTGNVDFIAERPVAELCKMAREQLDALMNACNGHPRENVTANASFTLPEGQTFTMSTGLSEAELAKNLEDMIVRMEYRKDTTKGTEDDTRSEFSALSTRQEKMEYVDNLKSGEKGDLKARAVIVMILHDNGVSDYESLSLPNRLNGEDARQLAKHFASMEGELTPDKLKGDSLFKEMAAKPPHVNSSNASAYIPATSTEEYNMATFRQMTNHREFDKLSLPYKQLMDDAINQVRTRLGNDAFPENTRKSDLLDSDKMRLYIQGQVGNNIRLTPENIRQPLLENALGNGANRIISNTIKKAMTEAGANLKNSNNVLALINSRHPEFAQRLASVQSPEETGSIVAEYKTKINDAIQRQKLVQELSQTSLQQAHNAIAEKLGVSVNVLLEQNVCFSHLESKISDMKNIFYGTQDGASKSTEEVKADFNNIVKKFVDERIRYLDKVDTLNLPQIVKDEVKVELLTNTKLKGINLDTLFEASKTIDMSKLENLLKSNASKEKVYNALTEISESIRSTVDVMLEKAMEEVGPDDRDGSINSLATMLVRTHQGLDTLLDAFLSRPDVKGDESESAVATNPFRRFSTDPDVNIMLDVHTSQIENLFHQPEQGKASSI